MGDKFTAIQIANTLAQQVSVAELNREVYEKKNLERTDEELKLLSQHTTSCTIKQLNKTNPNKFKTLLHDQFYNPAVLSSLMCTTETIFSLSSQIDIHDRIRHWLNKLQEFGEESTTGYALTSRFLSADDVFVVKVNKEDIPSYELTHEAFIGIFGTNRLRAYVPNFAYIFGTFSCSEPIFEDRDVVTWCTYENDYVRYVLYENIIPSVPFRSYLGTCTSEQFLQMYLQILYALRKAVEICGFTHYDLHPGNILIRKINGNSSFAIPYETENNMTEYIVTNRIATIIDYGRSHITLDGKDYSYWDLPSIIYNETFPMYDAYKLLIFSLYYSRRQGNIKVTDTCAKIFKFFNEKELEHFIDRKLNVLPLIYKYLKLDDFIRHIRKLFPLSVVGGYDGRILGCNGSDICFDTDETYNYVSNNIKTFFEFVDTYNTLSVEEKSDLVATFDYDNAKSMFIDEMKELLNSVKRIVTLPILTITDPDNLLFSLLSRYEGYVLNLVSLYDTLRTLEVNFVVWDKIKTIYGDDIEEETIIYGGGELKDIENEYNVAVDYLDKAKEAYTNDREYIDANQDVLDMVFLENLFKYDPILLL